MSKSNVRELNLKIINNSENSINGTANLDLPKDWSAISTPKTFNLKKGERISVKFSVTIPRNYKAGSYEIRAKIIADGETFTQTMHTIAYPHIQTHRYYTEAKTTFNFFDLKVAPVKIGYIMGSGDKVPQAIEQMGLSVTMLDENYLSSGDLSKFDTIVAGIRASQTRPDFVANNKRLLDFMKNGGTLIVQYQQLRLCPPKSAAVCRQKWTRIFARLMKMRRSKFSRRKIRFLTFRIKSRKKILKIGCRKEIYTLLHRLMKNIFRFSKRTTQANRKTKAVWFSPKSEKENIFIRRIHFFANFRLAIREHSGFLQIF